METSSPNTLIRYKHTYASWLVFILGVCYLAITITGLLTLSSATEPIGQPYFAIMEILIIMIAPLMTVSLIGVHYYAAPDRKTSSFAAVCFMLLMTAITSSVHFVSLTTGPATIEKYPRLLSFEWPSVIYSLDILAWDWFFALAMIFAATAFRTGRLEKTIRLLMIISGTLSLAGLAGVVTGNMQVRNIGIIGYGIVGPVAFLFLGILFDKKQSRCQLS